ncbi:unnamed protein product [Linum trigynum]|uniref:Uncharacterized protein n=1 Tax=Linum trigynum TaxID=586398 RepID=A0AAV2D8R7_9ROSI
MTNEVIWVAKATATSLVANGGGSGKGERSTEGGHCPKACSQARGDETPKSNEGDPVPVAGSTVGEKEALVVQVSGSPVERHTEGSDLKGSCSEICHGAGSQASRKVVTHVGTPISSYSGSGKLIDEDGFQLVTRKGKGIMFGTALKIPASSVQARVPLNAQGQALVDRGPPKKGRGRKHK